MKVTIKEHKFKVEVEQVKELENNKLDVSFLFKSSRIHILVDKDKYEGEKFIYLLTEPSFYKKKPKNLVWSFKEEIISQLYLNLIINKIREKEQKIFRRKNII